MKRDSRLYSRHLYQHGEGTEQSRWTIPPAPDGCRSYILTLPEDGDYLAQVIGALGILADSEHYTCDADRDAAAQAYQQAILSLTGWHGMVSLQQPGDIKIGAGTQTESWLLCDGSEYPIATYEALHSAIGDAFGETAPGWFKVPDLRDKFILGAGGNQLMGDTGGEDEHTLTVDEIPAHTHTYTAATLSAGLIGEIPASVVEPNPFSNTGSAGGGEAHNNIPPYVALGAWIFTGIPDCVTCDPPPTPEPQQPGMELIYHPTSNVDGNFILPITAPGFYRIDMRGVSNTQGTGWTAIAIVPETGTLAAWRETLEGFGSLTFRSDENAVTSTMVDRIWLPQTGAPGPTRLMHVQLWMEVTTSEIYTRWNAAVVQSASSAASERMGAVRGNSIATYTDLSEGIRVSTAGQVARWHRIHVWREAET
jgi:microcystin-dependent protein